MNPCRCGKATEPGFACKRQPNERCMAQYLGRISGPMLDRIDIAVDVPAVTAADLILPPPAEGSAEVAARVAAARERQRARFEAIGQPHILVNAAAPAPILDEIVKPDAQGLKLLRDAAEAMKLTARGYHRVLKVARTLADLDGEEGVPPAAHRRGAVLPLAGGGGHRVKGQEKRFGAGDGNRTHDIQLGKLTFYL